MWLQIHSIRFPQVYCELLWTNYQCFFTRVSLWSFFLFSKSCLKVVGAAYTQVQLIHKCCWYTSAADTQVQLINECSLYRSFYPIVSCLFLSGERWYKSGRYRGWWCKRVDYKVAEDVQKSYLSKTCMLLCLVNCFLWCGSSKYVVETSRSSFIHFHF